MLEAVAMQQALFRGTVSVQRAVIIQMIAGEIREQRAVNPHTVDSALIERV